MLDSLKILVFWNNWPSTWCRYWFTSIPQIDMIQSMHRVFTKKFGNEVSARCSIKNRSNLDHFRYENVTIIQSDLLVERNKKAALTIALKTPPFTQSVLEQDLIFKAIRTRLVILKWLGSYTKGNTTNTYFYFNIFDSSYFGFSLKCVEFCFDRLLFI